MDLEWAPFREWQPWGYCQGYNFELFFPTHGKKQRAAKELCAKCPVQQNCLNYAIAHDEDGIWGNTSQTERKRLPAFIVAYIKNEYERRNLYEARPNSDAILPAKRRKRQVVLSQEDLFSSLSNAVPPLEADSSQDQYLAEQFAYKFESNN